ncbi:MAG: alcohol dehydrogenase catalytic domain-containing protein [Gammaproteobacteria bacterium]
MTTQIKAAIITTPHGRISLETAELDDPRDDEILVRIDACGICHTDHKFQEVLELPAVLGHEGTGIVEATGRNVRTFKPGDRVILSYPWCGDCEP